MKTSDLKDCRIGIIGGGSMGGGAAIALAEADFNVVVSSPHPHHYTTSGGRPIFSHPENSEAARCDILIIAVKPWVLPKVSEEIAPIIKGRNIPVGVIVAGVSGRDLKEMLPDAGSLAIIMPNTAMAVKKSVTFMVDVVGEGKVFGQLFREMGSVHFIDERLLPGATALASCGIAYAMRYVRAAMEGGVEMGFKASEAQNIVTGTIEGAAALLSIPDSHPESEIDKVTTPGGKTIRGLNKMEACGFSTAVIEGLKASL